VSAERTAVVRGKVFSPRERQLVRGDTRKGQSILTAEASVMSSVPPAATNSRRTEALAMLHQQQPETPAATHLRKQRFLGSISGVLGELMELLLGSHEPIPPDTGAQIAQMLRAIREGASSHELDDIAHTTVHIETYLISGEPYGPGGDLRNVVLASTIERLLAQVADAQGADHPGRDHGRRMRHTTRRGTDRRPP
jgi:hypothetical protein